MATTEGFELQEKTRPAEPGELDAAPAGCGARDLKTILNRIADQIADADRRHSAALGTMQDRLVDLVRGTAQARSEQPTDALEPTLPSQAPAVAIGPVATEAMGLALAAASVESAPAAAPLDSPPAPLRSALAAGSFMRKDERDAAVDPFDVVGEEDRTGDDEPWDRASAEALTRIYEGEGFAPMHSFEAAEVIDAMPQQAAVEPEAAPAVSVAAIDHGGEDNVAVTPEAVDSTAPMMSGELAAVAGGAAAVVAAAVATAVSAPSMEASEPSATAREDIERAWLETKFADIATMLEQSLEAFRADGAVAVLEQRFEQLEAKLGGAFVDAATRSDVAGLKSIEAQVDELAQQFEAVQTQVARLGDIESELRMLGQHVSEERMTKLMAGAASVSPPLDEIAQRVAAEVIAKLPREDDRYNDSGRLDELRSIVKGFITEQRQGDEQTATMLDTMQQAMIRLLDRMDTLESGYEPVPAYPTYAASAEPAGLPPAETPSLRTAIEPAPPARVEADRLEPEVPAIQEARQQEQDAAAPADMVPEPQQEEKRSKATIVERTERSKEDFVASARRAAKQAAEAKSEEGMAADGAGKKASGVLAGGPAAGDRKASAAGGPSRLLIGVLAVFALGASFSIVNAVMKITNPPVEQRINVAPPDILKGNGSGNGSTPDALIDRDGEPDGNGGAGGSDTKREGGMRSGEQSPRMIAPDVESQRKMAGGTGRIVDDTGTPVGIVLQHSAAITRPEHIMRLEEQQQHATWSARLGAQQLPAPVVPAVMAPDTSALGDTVMPVTRQAATGESARTVNEMPPAFIGPNSLRSAAAKADPSAEFEVGARFAEGKGLQQDLKQAVAWYQRSASQGFAQAQYRLATMYERGLGVKTDLARAKVWYQRAAEQGTAKAMHNLAVLSTGREGVPADYTAAASWFAKASAYGLVDSQFNLAVLYDGGLGVAKDVVQAYKWYALAARAGDEEAVRRQEALRGKIGAAELAQITAEIDTWRALPIDPVANDPRVAGERWKLSGVVRAN